MPETSTCSSEGLPARASRSQDAAEGSRTRAETSRSSLQGWLFAHAPAGWSGRMCPGCSRAGADAILPRSFRFSRDGKSPFRAEDGARPASSPRPLAPSGWAGECLTLSIPEFPNFLGRSRSEGDVSSLWDILERGRVHVRHSLTARCAEGILRRAEVRGETLPPPLREALESASRSTSRTSTGG